MKTPVFFPGRWVKTMQNDTGKLVRIGLLVLASGLVEGFFSNQDLQHILPKNPLLSTLMGSGMGMVFPVCECGSVPLARRLMRRGLPLPAGIAFMLAAPVVNPIALASTAAAFGFGPMVLARLGLSAVIAGITGLITARLPADKLFLPVSAPAAQAAHPSHTHTHSAALTTRQRLGVTLNVAIEEFFEMGRFLVLGALLAAALQSFVPQAALLAFGEGAVRSVLALMGLAALLSVCSTVDAFIALGFSAIMPDGALLAFMVFGPMIDIKSVLMYRQVFSRQAMLLLISIPATLTFLAGVLINLLGGLP